MPYEPFDRDAYAQSLGLTRLPHPLNPQDLMTSLRNHYPTVLMDRGVTGRVLLSLELDASGSIIAAHAVEPQVQPGVTLRAIVVDKRTGERHEMEAARGAHPAFQRAAEAAVRVLRFAPAERDGQPVSFSDYRLTVELAPPSAV